MTKEEVLSKWLNEPKTSGKDGVIKAMDEWANQFALEEMTRLLRNMRSRPIECYSQKIQGQDKQYFLGHNFVEDLITSLKSQYK